MPSPHEPPQATPDPTTLDGGPTPQNEQREREPSSRPAPKKKGVATLSSLSHSNDEDDDEEDDHGRGDLFAGGEKSALAIHDAKQQPDAAVKKLIDDIVAKAKA